VVAAHQRADAQSSSPYDATIPNTSDMSSTRSARVRSVARVVLGGTLIVAGLGHLTFARRSFQAQVPDWVRIDKDAVVIMSGLVEIALGSALIVVRRRRALLGLAVGLFFIAVFPGNISQFIDGHDAFGLNSDSARRNRLFFQPVLVAWAWWSTEALTKFRPAHELVDL
jgi:uncharacterized membrane protein